MGKVLNKFSDNLITNSVLKKILLLCLLLYILGTVFCINTAFAATIDEPNALIMEFKIPANADTDGTGTTLMLPIPSGYTHSYAVDWGDGSAVAQFDGNTNFPSHEYTNSEETIYTIKVSGTVYKLGYFGTGSVPTATNTYKDYYTFCEYLYRVLQLGTLNYAKLSFGYCKNMISFTAHNSGCVSNLRSMEAMFLSCANLESIDVSVFDTTNIRDMTHMFCGCSKITTLDLSNFNTSNVTKMTEMFGNARKLQSLDLSNFDTSNVTDMQAMFYLCSEITNIVFSNNFKTHNVVNMRSMFGSCQKLTSLDVSNFDTSKVTDMSDMFDHCKMLTSIDVSNFNTSKVTNMSSMFEMCSSLTALDVSNFDTAQVRDMSCMFDSIRVSNLDLTHFNTANVTNMREMFSGAKGMDTIDLSSFDTRKVTNMYKMFYYSDYKTLDLSSFDTPQLTNMQEMFRHSELLTSVKMTNFNTSNVTNMYGVFEECYGLLSIEGLELFDTHSVTTMALMFEYCYRISSIDVSNFNTSNVTTLERMFNGCYALSQLDVSGFNTSKVTSMVSMFDSCRSIEYLDVSGFDTSKCKYLVAMFDGCEKLESIDVSSFRFDSLNHSTCGISLIGYWPIDIDLMFRDCKSLKTLDLSTWDTSIINKPYGLFQGCNNLETVLLGENFDKLNGKYQFSGCSNIKAIITLRDISDSADALLVSTDNNLSGFENVILYVPDTTSEGYYEASTDYASVFSSTQDNGSDLYRVRPILEVVGDNPKTINAGTTYTLAQDEGASVAGYSFKTESDNAVFTDFGYSVETSGLPITLTSNSTGDVTYTLKRNVNSTEETGMIVTRNLQSGVGVDEANALIMEWKIPANAGGLANKSETGFGNWVEGSSGSGTYVELPISSASTNSFVVDWGDGSSIEMFDNSAYFPQHKYTNTTETNYTIKVSGNVHMFGYSDGNTVTKSNTYRVYYSFTNYIISVQQLGVLHSYSYAFSMCKNLTSFTTGTNAWSSDITDMNSMFLHCDNLTELDTSSFNTSKVTSMRKMFSYSAIKNLDLTSFDTSKVRDMSYMFDHASKLEHLNVSSFNTSMVDGMTSMFNSCILLEELDVSNFDTSNVANMRDMFNSCKKITSLDVTNFNTSNVISMQGMFEVCVALEEIDISGFDTSNVTNMAGMFSFCNVLSAIDVSGFNTSKVTDMSFMFSACNAIKYLDLSGFNTQMVIDMNHMFSNCSELIDIDVSNFNTSNVVYMYGMFNGCTKARVLDVSNFNTEKVNSFEFLFAGCKALTTLDVSNFDTHNARNFAYMFSNCCNVETIDVSGFNTENATVMNNMFYKCSSVNTLDVSNFKFDSLTHLANENNESQAAHCIFKECSSLEYIDLSEWDTSNLTSLFEMFRNCSSLKTIVLGDKFDKLYGNNTFLNCSSLRSIIVTKDISNSNDALNIGIENDLSNLPNAILYVPNTTSEDFYESATNYSTIFADSRDNGADLYRVRPILELVGNNPYKVRIGRNYTQANDAGVKVAGASIITDTNNIIYTELGYSIITNGLPIVLYNNGDEAYVDYNLVRTVNGIGSTIATVRRNVICSDEPYGVIYSDITSNVGAIQNDILQISKTSNHLIKLGTGYLGEIDEPYLEISLMKKNGVNQNGTGIYQYISNLSNVIKIKDLKDNVNLSVVNSTDSENHQSYRLNDVAEEEQIQIDFLTGLANGSYKIRMVLKDQANKEYSEEAIIVEVND